MEWNKNENKKKKKKKKKGVLDLSVILVNKRHKSAGF